MICWTLALPGEPVTDGRAVRRNLPFCRAVQAAAEQEMVATQTAEISQMMADEAAAAAAESGAADQISMSEVR